MYNSNNIAERIKNLAKQKGVSLAALLLDASLGRNTMANFKTSMPKADNLARIADCLDCSVDYLLGRTDVPEVNRGAVPEPTHLIKMAARAGGGIREVPLTESQIEALKNLPEVPNLDDKK